MPPLKETETFAFDISNWRNKPLQEIILDASSGTIEASKGPLLKRVNPVSAKLETFRKWTDEASEDPIIMASTKIFNWAADNNSRSIEIWLDSTEPSENEILEAMSSFADLNPEEFIVWFSPRNETTFQNESRIGIYQVIWVNGQKYLFMRTLCNYNSAGSDARSAADLLAFSSEKIDPQIFTDPEILRATPIPIKITGTSHSAFFKNVIDMPDEVWEAIKEGHDLQEKIKMNRIAAAIITPEIIRQINSAETFREQMIIGAYLERELQIQSGRTLMAGSCGILYSSISLTNPVSLLGASSPYITEGGRRKHCGKCGKHGYFSEGETCPYDSSSRN